MRYIPPQIYDSSPDAPLPKRIAETMREAVGFFDRNDGRMFANKLTLLKILLKQNDENSSNQFDQLFSDR